MKSSARPIFFHIPAFSFRNNGTFDRFDKKVPGRFIAIEEIFLPVSRVKEDSGNSQNLRMKTIHENERDYIINVLKECNGRIWGAGGAAEILNVPPTTLRSKMKKLGISKENIV